MVFVNQRSSAFFGRIVINSVSTGQRLKGGKVFLDDSSCGLVIDAEIELSYLVLQFAVSDRNRF